MIKGDHRNTILAKLRRLAELKRIGSGVDEESKKEKKKAEEGKPLSDEDLLSLLA